MHVWILRHTCIQLVSYVPYIYILYMLIVVPFQHVPMAVLYGVFLYMGVTSLGGVQVA